MRLLLSALALGTAGLSGFDLLRAWQTGRILWRPEFAENKQVALAQQPVRFWMIVVFNAGLAAISVAIAWGLWHGDIRLGGLV